MTVEWGQGTDHPSPAEQALTIVRDGLRSVRIALGEVTEEQEGYAARHARRAVVTFHATTITPVQESSCC